MIQRDSPKRRKEILSATLKVLRSQGVTGASTLKIAGQAGCSKETIYNWFGDREGLFCALVEAQTQVMLEALSKTISSADTSQNKLQNFCAAILDLLTGDAVVLVNRAILPQMGLGFEKAFATLDERRIAMKAIGVELLEVLLDEGLLQFENSGKVYNDLFGMVIGERQIRVLMGDEDARPNGTSMNEIAAQAVAQLKILYPPKS